MERTEPALVPYQRRRVTRRPMKARCRAVSLRNYRVIGTEFFDISPYGLLIASEAQVEIGEELFVSFRVPGQEEWFHARAEVARIVKGHRVGDPGRCIGVHFTWIRLAERLALHDYLWGLPPPVPARRVPTNYAETIRQIAVA